MQKEKRERKKKEREKKKVFDINFLLTVFILGHLIIVFDIASKR